MAYDKYLGERIQRIMEERKAAFFTKKMMGGLIFMVNHKMCCGIHIDKKIGDSLLMAKIGDKAYIEDIKKENTLPMNFTGRPMKGFIFVTPSGFDQEEDLEYWIDKTLAYNDIQFGNINQ